jgi:hypothetical protein
MVVHVKLPSGLQRLPRLRNAILAVLLALAVWQVVIPYALLTVGGPGMVYLRTNGHWCAVNTPVAFLHGGHFRVQLIPITYGLVGFVDDAPGDGVVLGGCGGGVRYLVVVCSPWWSLPAEDLGTGSYPSL